MEGAGRMSTTTDTAAADEAGRRDALAEWLFKSLIEANELVGWFAAGEGGDDAERLNDGFSFWHCLPASRAEVPSVAAGTVLRSATVREWSGQAGFASLEVLPVDHLFWRFYRLTG
jgi:hypothetical protein